MLRILRNGNRVGSATRQRERLPRFSLELDRGISFANTRSKIHEMSGGIRHGAKDCNLR